ncbi:MAG: hypothetical protein K2H64_02760 [Desulfovibrio sp.]|nr:hypothetical protein [Desulfovibrio sp.]
MIKLAAIAFLLLLSPSFSLADNVWNEGQKYFYMKQTKLADNSSFEILARYCVDTADKRCVTGVDFQIACGYRKEDGYPLADTIRLEGSASLEDDKVIIRTRDGSEFILSSLKRIKESPDEYGAFEVNLKSRFSPKFHSMWSGDYCKRKIGSIASRFGELTDNVKLESYLGD